MSRGRKGAIKNVKKKKIKRKRILVMFFLREMLFLNNIFIRPTSLHKIDAGL